MGGNHSDPLLEYLSWNVGEQPTISRTRTYKTQGRDGGQNLVFEKDR